LTERLKFHIKISAFFRYVDVIEDCVISEEMFVVFSHLARKLGLHRKQKILSTAAEDGLCEKSQECILPTFSRAAKYTTSTHRTIICRFDYIFGISAILYIISSSVAR
jgi:hypothetical protein